MFIEKPKTWFWAAFILLIAVGLSACASVPQGYQTTDSTAAVTSTLGGSAIVVPSSGPISVAHISGAYNHQSRALTLNVGNYVFVDSNGPSATGVFSDGAGTTVTADLATSAHPHMFDYVAEYRLSSAGEIHAGLVGIVTKTVDIPSAGSASFTGAGTAMFQTINLSGVGSAAETYLSWGTSTVAVNFALGSATVNMDNFASIADGNGAAYAPGANPIDQVRGTGLAINGAQLSGGTWETLKNGAVVQLLGPTATASSAGTFFGYDPTISGPAEVGGVMLISGDTQVGSGIYIAN